MENYSNEIDKVVKYELSKLIELKRAAKGPFEEGLVQSYYEKLKKMKKS